MLLSEMIREFADKVGDEFPGGVVQITLSEDAMSKIRTEYTPPILDENLSTEMRELMSKADLKVLNVSGTVTLKEAE